MKLKLLGTLVGLVLFFGACAQGGMAVRVVKQDLFIPWEIIYGPDARIWFTQKNGFICRLEPVSGLLDTVYHETATVIRGEGGMTGLALHPDFPNTPFLYAVHNYLNGTNYRIRVMRYTYNGTNALSAPMVLLDGISGSQNHNGSRLLIIADKLFITTGDAENLANPQNTASINGKVLRINLDGSIPADNPFAGNPVWSKGHRNPQGLVAANGFLYSSEHGPSTDDEVNIIRKGRNYGWPNVEGFCDKPAELVFCTDSNVAEPIKAWTPTLAVAGLDYYTQPMFPSLNGHLLMATLKDAHLYSLTLNAGKDAILASTIIPIVNEGRLRDICISPAGKIYVSTSNSNASGNGAFTDKILEIFDPAATKVEAVANEDIRIYPNPVQDRLTVIIREANSQYAIRDLLGRVLKCGSLEKGSNQILTGDFMEGNYVLEITGSERHLKTLHFVKVK